MNGEKELRYVTILSENIGTIDELLHALQDPMIIAAKPEKYGLSWATKSEIHEVCAACRKIKIALITNNF